MSEVLELPDVELRTSGLSIGLSGDPVTLGLRAKVLNTSWQTDHLNGVLETKNLIIRLSSPDGSQVGTDLAPFFKGEPGGLTQADRDQMVWAIQDTVIAAAIAAVEPSAKSAAQAVMQAEADARMLADNILTASVKEVTVAQQTQEESVALQITTIGARIDENVAALQSEKVARADAEMAISLRIDQTVAVSGDNTAAIRSEETARTDADSAITKRIDVLLSSVDTNKASIVTEQQTRADADSALSTRIDVLSAKAGSSDAAITTLQQAQANSDAATASSIQTLTAKANENAAAISSETTARSNADYSLATRIDSLTVTVNGNSAAITAESTARATADSAMSSRVDTLTSSVNGNTASIQAQQTSINGLSAQYSIKIDNNGYVSGFGLSSYPVNGAPQSYFNVLADHFTIQLPGYAGIQPFTVQLVNGVPQLSVASAVIGDAAITRAKIGIAEIDTLRIAGEAVTVPRAATSPSGIAPSDRAVVACSVYMPPGITAIIANASGIFTSAYMTAGQVFIRKNGNIVSRFDWDASFDGAIPLAFLDTAQDGGTFDVLVSASTTWRNVSLVCLGVKR